jgi:hypothetical protein
MARSDALIYTCARRTNTPCSNRGSSCRHALGGGANLIKRSHEHPTVNVTASVRGIDLTELVATINGYRVSRGLPSIPVSVSLTRVAEAHVRDLEINSPHGGVCNAHSWSSSGNWTACCYTADHAQAECVWRKPREITGGVYTGNGYEIAISGATDLSAVGALAVWQGSQPHHDVILNRATWADNVWRAVGAANSGRFAVVWFGELSDPAR